MDQVVRTASFTSEKKKTKKPSLIRKVRSKFSQCVRKILPQKKAEEVPQYKSLDPIQNLTLSLSYLIVKTDRLGQYQISCSEVPTVFSFLSTYFGDQIRLTEADMSMDMTTAVECLHLIISHSVSINHLYFDCNHNGKMAEVVANYFVERENEQRRRILIEKLTIVGSWVNTDFDWFTKLVLLCRRSLVYLCLHDVTICSREQSRYFWAAVGQCSKLTHLQYESKKRDEWSRQEIYGALGNRKFNLFHIRRVSGLRSTTSYAKIGRSSFRRLLTTGKLKQYAIV